MKKGIGVFSRLVAPLLAQANAVFSEEGVGGETVVPLNKAAEFGKTA